MLYGVRKGCILPHHMSSKRKSLLCRDIARRPMRNSHHQPRGLAEHTHPTTPEERQERKQRIQTHGRSSVTRSIADAIVIKAGDMFFLSEPNGRVPLGGTHSYGLYYHDCRFLNGSASEKGLVTQGWKDSGDAVVNTDGTLAQPPISLSEVQGYVYRAKTSLAGLYAQAGEAERAAQLQREAQQLRVQCNRDFWLADKQCYALALQAQHKPVAVISSNPGQALWTGIADSDKGRQTVARLMADDMFSGWGMRTLSAQERRYNPIGYHLGTVWPHDNALIAAGFRRYGCNTEACRIFGIVEAATHFAHYRLPEVFAGFRKADYGIPVRYPVACQPQAWAAGSVPFLSTTALRLVPEAFAHRLRIVQPILPDFLQQLEVHRLRVGDGCADLLFARRTDSSVAVTVMQVEGRLEVVTESEATPAQS